MSWRRLGVAVVAAGLGGLAAATAALAHVQVLPGRVAPSDPVLFTVLVPNESDTPTTAVELRFPDGVVPFSFEPVPGWKRSEKRAANGALQGVVWTGSLPVGSFVRFAFLAATPGQPGELRWRALQTYGDGTVVRWIGPPGSDEPAAVTVVAQDAPRQNAGGESGGEVPPAETDAAPVTPAPTPTPAEPATGTDGPETAAPEPAPVDTETVGLVPLQPEPAPVETAAAAPTSGGSGGDDGLTLLAIAIAAAALTAAVIALVVSRRREGGPGAR